MIQGRPTKEPNYIRLNNVPSLQFRSFSTKNDFFKDEFYYLLLDGGNKLIFRHPDIDYPKVPNKCKKMQNGWYTDTIKAPDAPTGKFFFDESESNEDQLVIYLDEPA